MTLHPREMGQNDLLGQSSAGCSDLTVSSFGLLDGSNDDRETCEQTLPPCGISSHALLAGDDVFANFLYSPSLASDYSGDTAVVSHTLATP